MICGFSFCRRFSFQLLPSASPHAICLGAIFDFVFGSGRRGDLRFSFQYFSISVFSIFPSSIFHLSSCIFHQALLAFGESIPSGPVCAVRSVLNRASICALVALPAASIRPALTTRNPKDVGCAVGPITTDTSALTPRINVAALPRKACRQATRSSQMAMATRKPM
jgi:hypothetical protein